MTLPIYLIAVHFVGDFLLQTNWMALNKSKKMSALLSHTILYAVFVTLVLWGVTKLDFLGLLVFGLLTFCTHTLTDLVTSQLTSAFWFVRIFSQDDVGGETYFYGTYDMLNRKLFFLTLGFDQLLHYVTLAWTLKYIGG